MSWWSLRRDSAGRILSQQFEIWHIGRSRIPSFPLLRILLEKHSTMLFPCRKPVPSKSSRFKIGGVNVPSLPRASQSDHILSKGLRGRAFEKSSYEGVSSVDRRASLSRIDALPGLVELDFAPRKSRPARYVRVRIAAHFESRRKEVSRCHASYLTFMQTVDDSSNSMCNLAQRRLNRK